MFPPGVHKILETLNQAGYEAYVVGGAVRDILLGRRPKEFDICTDACPRAVLDIAAKNNIKAFRKGAAFGVISWILEGQEYEIATFRTETYGEDAHRPEKVEFVWALEDDLARRDFTVNAMAMDRAGTVIDPLGGREDLRRGLLRAVGDPEERFAEDALRMFRACRFVAEYGFRVERQTRDAIGKALGRVAGLSVERVRDELDKLLVAPYAADGLELMRGTGLLTTECRCRADGREQIVAVLPEVARLVHIEQNPRYHTLDVWGHTLRVVANIPPEPVLRWAALLHDIAKGSPGVRCLNKHGEPSDYGHARVGADMARKILNRLRVPPAITRRVVWLVRHHMNFPGPERRPVIKWLRRLAASFAGRADLAEAVRQLLELRSADLRGGKVDPEYLLKENDLLQGMVEKVLWQVPFYPEDLAVSGGDVAEIMGRGPQVKRTLDDLVASVQAGRLENHREVLLAALKRKAARLCNR
ncbi:MAG: HD domain-containing protein [Peptococcaceae bacterium]|nr:HD domain-containing protein [Peptococcaceae bacterium]